MMDVMGRDYQRRRGGGVSPGAPPGGAPDDGFDQSSRGRVGGGQGGAARVSY